jgi:hypothetical protein
LRKRNREKETQRETEKQRNRETEKQRDIKTETIPRITERMMKNRNRSKFFFNVVRTYVQKKVRAYILFLNLR